MVQNAVVKKIIGEGVVEVSLLRQMECGLHCDGACEGCGQKPTEESPEDMPAQGMSPEEAVLRREEYEALRRALAALPQRDRTLFYRKYYYMQATAQIAAELGTTERAVEGRLYRIRARLKKMLGGEEHE